jgi:hypothetical protein
MENASTQQFIDIAGIHDGIVVLKTGGYRMIFSVSALNFSLKSEEEQNSLIFQYQSFLNSLHFPIQIVMRSKKLDLNPYIKKINEQKDKQTSELIKIQTEDYLDFISELINLANIMKKTFYVVVPFDPVSVKGGSIMDKLFKKNESTNIRVSDAEFKRYKDEISERGNTVATGLGGMGLHCVQLTTEEIIELFYKIYNPDMADKARFSNVDELTSSYVADIREKKNEVKEGKIPDEIAASAGEPIIDNSAIVEEKYKQESQLKERALDKDGEKQIARTPEKTEAQEIPANKQPEPSAQQQVVSAPVKTDTNAQPQSPNINSVANQSPSMPLSNNPTTTPPPAQQPPIQPPQNGSM